MRLLGRHDAGDACRTQHVALLGVAVEDHLQRCGQHGHRAFGNRRALGLRLGADVDHMRFAGSADMGEAAFCVSHGGGLAPLRLRASSSARVAASTSACRIRLSPTRKVAMPCRASRSQSAWVKMPLSDTSSRSAGTIAASRSEVSSEVLKLTQIAVVDADQLRAQFQRPLQLCLVMHFDRAHPCQARTRPSSSARASLVGKAGHDDQDGVGAPGARLVDLVGLEHEILAQRRQCGGIARGGEIFRRALERGRIGQHREARRTACRIGAGQAPADRSRRGSSPWTGLPS